MIHDPSKISILVVAMPLEFVLASSSVNMYGASPSPETAVAVACCVADWLSMADFRALAVVPSALVNSSTTFAPEDVSL